MSRIHWHFCCGIWVQVPNKLKGTTFALTMLSSPTISFWGRGCLRLLRHTSMKLPRTWRLRSQKLTPSTRRFLCEIKFYGSTVSSKTKYLMLSTLTKVTMHQISQKKTYIIYCTKWIYIYILYIYIHIYLCVSIADVVFCKHLKASQLVNMDSGKPLGNSKQITWFNGHHPHIPKEAWKTWSRTIGPGWMSDPLSFSGH